MRPYTRSLDVADYAFLPHAPRLRSFVEDMDARRIPHRGWHEHRLWEYGSIMQQLEDLAVPKTAWILDVGSGGSFFPPYLSSIGGYANVVLTDSMAGGDVNAEVSRHRSAYGVKLPLFAMPAEHMPTVKSDSFDVTMCISVIEHVRADRHDDALRELCRVTKLGGYIFITSDYFRDVETQLAASPWRDFQLTPYTADLVKSLPSRIPVEFVCGTDLDYRGDFVHNYSFVNVCLRKKAA